MTKDEVRKLIEGVSTERRTLTLVFNQGGIPELKYLWGMLRSGTLTTQPVQAVVITAIVETSAWDGNFNRKVEVKASQTFDPDWFVDRLSSGLESLSVA